MRARQVPDQDLAVQRAAVERRAVAADRQRGDPAVVAGEDLALRRVADVPDDDRPSVAAVMAKRPSALKMPRSTTPSWLAGGDAHLPGPQVGEAHGAVGAAEQHVWPSGLSAVYCAPPGRGAAPAACGRRGRRCRAPAASAVTSARPSRAGHEAREAVMRESRTVAAEPAARPPVEPQHERAAAGAEPADGVERPPVGREAQAVDERSVAADLQVREDAVGRGVEDDRLAAADRDPRPVGAVAQLVEADERVDDAAW